MKGNAICRIWGGLGLGLPKVTGNVTIRQCTYNFLSDLNRNYASTLYHFLVIASYSSKVANFNLPHLHLAPLLGVTLFEFP